MEKLLGILHSHGRSERVISLPALAPPWSLTRPVADWLGMRRRHPLCREEDFPTTNLQSPFDVDYDDSTAFHASAQPHHDWKFEPSDSDFSHAEPAILFGIDFFDDSEIIGQPRTEHELPLNHDLVLANDEFFAASSNSLSHPPLGLEKFRSFAFSFVFHLAALSLFIACPTPSLTGIGGISDKPIFVRLTETREVNTPNDPSPASIDSPASMASLARRDLKSEEAKIRKEIGKALKTEGELEKVSEEGKINPRLVEAKLPKEPLPAHQRVPPERSLKDDHPNDSRSLHDSVASTPSVATPEREGPLKAGDEAQTYKDLIFAAIHEAAYYPKAALRNMAHGQTVVRFTINKDGSLSNISIVAHADSQALDEAALKIVKKAAAKFPSIPDALMRDQVTYVVPIVFKKVL